MLADLEMLKDADLCRSVGAVRPRRLAGSFRPRAPAVSRRRRSRQRLPVSRPQTQEDPFFAPNSAGDAE
jgi:hypothetical protein